MQIFLLIFICLTRLIPFRVNPSPSQYQRRGGRILKRGGEALLNTLDSERYFKGERERWFLKRQSPFTHILLRILLYAQQ